MNRIIWALCLCTLLTLFVSCKKNSNQAPDAIVGSWELRQTSGGMIPGAHNYPEGNGSILKFTADVYEKYTDSQLIQSGHYTIISDPTVIENVCLEITPGQYTNRIIYDGNTGSKKEFIEIASDKLIFISGCYALDGGHSDVYGKLKDDR